MMLVNELLRGGIVVIGREFQALVPSEASRTIRRKYLGVSLSLVSRNAHPLV